MLARFFALVLFVTSLLASSSAPAAMITIRGADPAEPDRDVELFRAPGETVELELVLDTGGLSLEGYSYGINITGGVVSSIDRSAAAIGGLTPDLFGPPVIDDAAGTLRLLNQGSFSGSVVSGSYVVDTVSFVVESFGPMGEITIQPGLFLGDSLGLDEGSCPGTVPGCSVSFNSLTIVPEPSVHLSFGVGLLVLGSLGRRLRV